MLTAQSADVGYICNKAVVKDPPYLKHVATLPCEILMYEEIQHKTSIDTIFIGRDDLWEKTRHSEVSNPRLHRSSIIEQWCPKVISQ